MTTWTGAHVHQFSTTLYDHLVSYPTEAREGALNTILHTIYKHIYIHTNIYIYTYIPIYIYICIYIIYIYIHIMVYPFAERFSVEVAGCFELISSVNWLVSYQEYLISTDPNSCVVADCVDHAETNVNSSAQKQKKESKPHGGYGFSMFFWWPMKTVRMRLEALKPQKL